jgi:glycosyltransferase involved in cell wall biosynthesis
MVYESQHVARGPQGVNVLFASIAFPPKSDPEALQAARYFKYLVQHPGLAIDVVTSRNPTLWMPTDEALRAYTHGLRQMVELPIFEPRLLSVALLKFLPGVANLPDMRQSFHWQWRRVPAVLRVRPDVVYSRSMPLSSTILGYKLARHYGVPWILHLSDPWTESAILAFRGPARAYNEHMQAACFARASAITLASPRMVELYRARHPDLAAKFYLMPNVYDPDDVRPVPARTPGQPLRLVYTGSLQGGRSVGPFLRVLAWCMARDPAALEHLSVELAGSLDSAEREALASARFACVRHVGILSLVEAQRLQREADVLLVFDTRLRPEDSVFFPSKLLDYLVTGRPIFAITSPGSMTREIVSAEVGRCFDHDETEAAGRHLLRLIGQHRAGDSIARAPRGSADQRFSAPVNAARLAALMKEVR